MDHVILDRQLKAMGFDLEELSDFATLIHYEGLSLLNLWEDDDENFFRMALPRFYDVTDDNRAQLLDIVNRINLQLKYTKICVDDDSIWAYYEHFVTTETNVESLLEHAIHTLQVTLFTFHHYIDGDETEEDDDDEEIHTSDSMDDLVDVGDDERSVLEQDNSDVIDVDQ